MSGRDERAQALSDALARRGVLRLGEAAHLLGVSEMTVRRDVTSAPGRFAYLGGHILSTAGIAGAVGYEFDREEGSNTDAKAAACAHAAALIEPDSTIFIDCGTTLIHLVDRIPENRGITAICYSLNVADRLSRRPGIRMILLGGLYHPASASFAGDEAIAVLARFGINRAFISAGGYDKERGVSCSHLHEVPIKQKAIAAAQESHLVIDLSKIGRVRPAFFARAGDFRSVVTEEGELA